MREYSIAYRLNHEGGRIPQLTDKGSGEHTRYTMLGDIMSVASNLSNLNRKFNVWDFVSWWQLLPLNWNLSDCEWDIICNKIQTWYHAVLLTRCSLHLTHSIDVHFGEWWCAYGHWKRLPLSNHWQVQSRSLSAGPLLCKWLKCGSRKSLFGIEIKPLLQLQLSIFSPVGIHIHPY